MNSQASAAVIDVGSNSIRYMEAAVARGRVTALLKCLKTTRLAEGMDAAGLLGEASMARSQAAIAGFACRAAQKGLPVYAYATSAVRDAQNGPAFCARVREACGVALEVLGGEEEARCAYLGAVGARGGGLIDVGGGSAQAMLPGISLSWPVGCVRAKEAAAGLPFAEAQQCIERFLRARGCAPTLRAEEWTGVGGTITTLGALSLGLTAYDPARVREAVITPDSLQAQLRALWEMGEARRAHPLLRERHDIICYGGMVTAGLMRRMDIRRLCVSDADGMEGFLLARLGRA